MTIISLANDTAHPQTVLFDVVSDKLNYLWNHIFITLM
jgi:hypothetical protein